MLFGLGNEVANADLHQKVAELLQLVLSFLRVKVEAFAIANDLRNLGSHVLAKVVGVGICLLNEGFKSCTNFKKNIPPATLNASPWPTTYSTKARIIESIKN